MLQAMLLLLGPALIKRVLAGLGIGVITYTVSTAVLGIILTSLQNNIAGMPSVVLQMVSLYGLPDFIGIILGAHSTSLTITTIKKFGFL